jgi:predicted ester cyclase
MASLMSTDTDSLQRNKEVVLRFNREVIERRSAEAFHELMDPSFVNRTAPPGLSPGPEGMLHMLTEVLRVAFPDLRVEIHAQIAEGDLVTTRKTLHGTHQGPLMGIAPTGKKVAIDVIDIVRVRDGKYVEHWGINTLSSVVAQLRGG